MEALISDKAMLVSMFQDSIAAREFWEFVCVCVCVCFLSCMEIGQVQIEI